MARICPVCNKESPDEARYCFDPSCLSPLDPAAEAPPAPLAPPPEEHRRRVPPWAWAAGAVGVAAVAGGIVLAVASLGGSAAKSTSTTVATTVAATTVQTSTGSTAPTTTVAIRGTPVDPSMVVAAEATSTLPDQEGLTYGIANTLDGQITTGWNSNGSTPGSGVPPVGQKLTYKLSAPQHIVGVRVINGYNPNDGKHQFTDNNRVQSLIVRGGGKERTVELADTFAPQFVEVDLPNADTIELEVASVYPTTKWADVGITEVQFFGG